MPRPLTALLVPVLVAAASPAHADNWRDCAGDDMEKARRACSRIISVRAQVRDKARLAIAYANRGRVIAAGGDCAAATADFDAAITLDGRSRMALAGRGTCRLQAGRIADARGDFDAALAIEPKDIAALFGRGRAAERANDIAQARRDFADALALVPASPAEEQILALARERLKALGGTPGGAVVKTPAAGIAGKRGPHRPVAIADWTQCEAMAGPSSIAACTRIIDAESDSGSKGLAALAYHFRGRTVFFRGDQIAAAEDLRFAARLVRDLAVGFHERGRLYLEQRDPIAALKDFDEALRRKPGFSEAQRDRARALISLGRNEQALTQIEMVLSAQSSNPLALIVRGLALQAKGELHRARSDLERAFSSELGANADQALVADGRRALTILASGGPGPAGAGALRQAGPLGPDLSRVPADALWSDCRSDAPETSLRGCAAILRQGSGLSDELRAYALYRSGVAQGRLGRFDAAILDFDASLRFMPAFVGAIVDRGIAWGRKGDNEKALADFERAYELKPNDARTLLNRGVAFERLRRYDRAIADYTGALRLQPGYVLALLNRGLLYKLQGEATRARADLEAVLAAPAISSEIQRFQARARDALAALPEAPAVQAPSAAELADCRSNEADKAIAACSRIISRGRTEDLQVFAEVHRRRAIAYRSKGDLDRSLADATAAIALVPALADGYVTRGVTYERKGDLARALEDYAAATLRNPAMAVAWSNKAAAHFKRSEWQAAIEAYTRAVGINPKDHVSFMNRGVAHGRLKNVAAAIEDYSAAIRVKADYAIAWSNRSIANMLAGNLDAALADANEAIRLRPTYINALVHRADLHKRRSDVVRARADLTAALSITPSNDEERQRLARARDLLAGLDAGASSPGPAPVSGGGDAQPAGGAGASAGPVRPDGLRQVALVIGNAAYTNAPQLDHPAIDAREVASALKRLGFDEIVERRDMTKAEIEGELKAFGDLAADADWAVIYVSGYGMQVGGRNYFLPIDARIERPSHIEDEAIGFDRLLTKVRDARGLRLVIVDACRDNPFLTRLAGSKAGGAALRPGLAAVAPGAGEVVATCAAAGQVVSDGTQRHSPFTFALLAHLEQGHELSRLFDLVRADVSRALGERAAPAIYGRLPATGYVLRPAAQ